MKKIIWLVVAVVFVFSLLASVQAQGLAKGKRSKEAYHTASEIISHYVELENLYPTLVSHVTLNYTVYGSAIYMFQIGNATAPKVLIDASMHGTEYASSEILLQTVQWILKQDEVDTRLILANTCLLVIPIVNIDKYRISYNNARNVNLNRNFETGWGLFNDSNRGAYFLSEPETFAVHQLFIDYQPEWYLNLHIGDYRVSPPWGCYDYTPEPEYYMEVYGKIAVECNERGVSTIPYEPANLYGGGLARDDSYYHGTYSFCIELSSFTPSYSNIATTIVPKFKPVVIAVGAETSK